MKYRRENNRVLVRIDKGEEIMQTLVDVCTKEKIYGAFFSGIGACEEVTVSCYNPKTKDFNVDSKDGMLEIVSLIGNISKQEDKPYAHIHAAFVYLENEEQKILAGHLKNAVVGLTCEIALTIINPIPKKYNEEVNLNIWDI